MIIPTQFRLVPALLFLVLWSGMNIAAAAPQTSETFTYIATATPYDASKKLSATAEGDDETTMNGIATNPGNKYYNITMTLKKGVNYVISFDIGGVRSPETERVFHPLRTPSLIRNTEILLDRKPMIQKQDPTKNGLVLLTAKTANQSFNAAAMHLVNVVPNDGGSWSRSTKVAKAGTAFAFVKPGNNYTVGYYVDAKVYEHKGQVATDGRPVEWTLEDKGRRKVPCTYVYGPWGKCIGGKKYREVKGADPADCDGAMAAVLDTICSQSATPRPDPVNPTDPTPATSCLSWEVKWMGPCEGGRERGVWTGIPEGCGIRPDTVRKCSSETIPPKPGDPPPRPIPSDKPACSIWHLMVVSDLPNKWTVGETRDVTATIDPGEYTRVVQEIRANRDLGDDRKDLIAVNDSVLLELRSVDTSFAIVDPGRKNKALALLDKPVNFTWTVSAKKQPASDSAEIVIDAYTIDCATGKLDFESHVSYHVKVKITAGGWFKAALTWLNKSLTEIAGILAIIAGIIAYFKGWFGGLLKRKEKKEGEGQA